MKHEFSLLISSGMEINILSANILEVIGWEEKGEM
jgi:hypothetical protein